MRKIVCIVGARPQFIKHFPLELELNKHFRIVTIHTGQHYDQKMSDVFFNELNISKPSYQFNLKNSSHGGQTGEMLGLIEEVLLKEAPSAVLVYGDTNSTLAGSLAAAKLNLPVIHVEAGLRSRNKTMPEEINRILTDHVSSYLFCSSDLGVNNLKSEGITQGVYICGDLMKDALKILEQSLKPLFERNYIFATFHRPYNTDNTDRMKSIITVLDSLPYPTIFPVHPRTQKALASKGINLKDFKSIRFIEPVGYIDSLSYQKFSKVIITDSGGIQKEAYWLKRKCITVRSETEWTETLEGNWNSLVFHNVEEIAHLSKQEPLQSTYNHKLYGNGDSSQRINEVLLQQLP